MQLFMSSLSEPEPGWPHGSVKKASLSDKRSLLALLLRQGYPVFPQCIAKTHRGIFKPCVYPVPWNIYTYNHIMPVCCPSDIIIYFLGMFGEKTLPSLTS